MERLFVVSSGMYLTFIWSSFAVTYSSTSFPLEYCAGKIWDVKKEHTLKYALD